MTQRGRGSCQSIVSEHPRLKQGELTRNRRLSFCLERTRPHEEFPITSDTARRRQGPSSGVKNLQ